MIDFVDEMNDCLLPLQSNNSRIVWINGWLVIGFDPSKPIIPSHSINHYSLSLKKQNNSLLLSSKKAKGKADGMEWNWINFMKWSSAAQRGVPPITNSKNNSTNFSSIQSNQLLLLLIWWMKRKLIEQEERRRRSLLWAVGLLRLVFSLCGAVAGPPALNPQREKAAPPAPIHQPSTMKRFSIVDWFVNWIALFFRGPGRQQPKQSNLPIRKRRLELFLVCWMASRPINSK